MSRSKPSCFILDCSMTMAWFFRDEGTPYSSSIRRSLKDHSALVPALWAYEVANALTLGIKRQRSTRPEAEKSANLLVSLPIRVKALPTSEVLIGVLDLACRHQLTAYDASYLYIALASALPIASLDKRVNDVAIQLGIDRFDPEKIIQP